tara:strand:- start:149 stop:616 length:468 start_codon:yes stop_codon:yes gene_type:complete
MQSFLKWWLIICITLIGVLMAVYFDMHEHLYNSDQTKISILILFIFVCSTVWIGNKTYSVAVNHEYESSEVGWFIAETCLALGMVGTITGFLLMLSTTFSNIDVSDVATLQRALADMALGMSTALYTTLIGLISSILIKIQLINLEVVIDETRYP